MLARWVFLALAQVLGLALVQELGLALQELGLALVQELGVALAGAGVGSGAGAGVGSGAGAEVGSKAGRSTLVPESNICPPINKKLARKIIKVIRGTSIFFFYRCNGSARFGIKIFSNK